MNEPDVWIAVAAGLSAIVAVVALLVSLKNQGELQHHRDAIRGYERHKAQIDERMLALEEARDRQAEIASERAHLNAGYARPYVYVSNYGSAPATSIRLFLDDVPWAEHEAVRGRGPQTLAPGGHWEGQIIAAATVADPRKITLLYADAHGEHKWMSTIG